jgi:lipopolysaccharide transport system ATP-binding protein
MSDSEIIITAENLSKVYRIWETPAARLKSPLLAGAASMFPKKSAPHRALHARAARGWRDFYALHDVSFTLRRGEAIGIIGRNGSGKSTLLQLIAGTLTPTTGRVKVSGRISALLELGSGFNPDFTGRENVFLSGAIYGLSQREMEKRFDDIARFADIGDFIDQPVKTYSSGMVVRLAFAVQSAVDPQLLIVDEALAVGDIFFQQKCAARMRELQENGTTIVLVSHDLGSVQHFCQRTMVFQRGHMVYHGPSAEATKVYFQIEQKEKAASFAANPAKERRPSAPSSPVAKDAIPGWPGPEASLSTAGLRVIGNGWAQCSVIAVCNAAGEPRTLFKQGETMAVFYEFEILHDMEFCVGCITIRDKTTQAVHSKVTLQDGIRTPAFAAKGTRLRFRQDTALNLACADYTLDVELTMIAARLLDQPGITYDEFTASELRVCQLHGVATLSVRLREESHPFQLLHFGMTGLPSSSIIEIHKPLP